MRSCCDLIVANREHLAKAQPLVKLGHRARDHAIMAKLRINSLKEAIEKLNNASAITPKNIIILSHAALDARLIAEGIALLTVSSHELQEHEVSRSRRGDWLRLIFDRGISNEFPGFFPVASKYERSDGETIEVWDIADDEALDWEQTKNILQRSGDFLHETYKPKAAEDYAGFFENLSSFAASAQRLLSCCSINFPTTQGGLVIITDFDTDKEPEIYTNNSNGSKVD